MDELVWQVRRLGWRIQESWWWVSDHPLGAGAGAAGVAAIALVLALGLGGGSGGPATTPLAQAAERTAEGPGARIKLSATYSLADSTVEMSGHGTFNRAGDAHLQIHSDSAPTATAAEMPGGFEMEEIGIRDGSTENLYMRSPAFSSKLPGGAEWMEIRVKQGGSPQSLDPRQLLQQLSQAGDVETSGEERVRGVPTTRYSATLDMRAEVERLRAAGEDAAADQLEQAIAVFGTDTQHVDVWVGKGVVRRMHLGIPFSLDASSSGQMDMTMDFHDFGVDPKITAPDPGSVYDATDLADGSMTPGANLS